VVLADPKHGLRCQMARIATGQVRAYALFQNGRLGAVFFTAGAQTARGVRIGSSKAAVLEAYGASRLTFMPARDDAAGIHGNTKPTYLGDGRALRFDSDPRTGLVQQIGLGGRL
jgi:hypothetical protein